MGLCHSKSCNFFKVIKWSLFLFHVLGDRKFCWGIYLRNVTVGFGIFRLVPCTFLFFNRYQLISCLSSQMLISFFYQRACLHLVMRGWISHPKDGLLVVLTILKCIWALRICMLLVLPKNFYLSFWKEKKTSIWWTIFWKQCSPWYSAWYFRLVTRLV